MRNFTYYLGLILFLCSTCFGGQWLITWDTSNQGKGVNYQVIRWDGDAHIILGDTGQGMLVVEANAGDKISVIAFNELGEAEPSIPILIPRPPSSQRFKVTLQVSNDLKEWKDKVILFDNEYHFFRLQIQKE